MSGWGMGFGRWWWIVTNSTVNPLSLWERARVRGSWLLIGVAPGPHPRPLSRPRERGEEPMSLV
ncbi:hypothetical protein GCM10017655_21600 [Pseudomonas turukhanskensis]|uniref:Uncharacterized protein n=1 Tax=Pseudomonas turukhanskensis TaxID=1806536 RepID=A0A9W6NFK5_9PSED|nr:hypothetical protein GCM10017655_21600 [Pseudomonas turukhanskensis]